LKYRKSGGSCPFLAGIRRPSLPIIESDARRIEIDPSNPNRIWWSGDTSSHLGYIEVLDQ
jgi:hypothetical protein